MWYILFHPFTFKLSVSLYLNISFVTHIVGLTFCIQSDSLPPVWEFGLFLLLLLLLLCIFNVITNIVEIESTMLLHIFYFSHLFSLFPLLPARLWTNLKLFFFFFSIPSVSFYWHLKVHGLL